MRVRKDKNLMIAGAASVKENPVLLVFLGVQNVVAGMDIK